MDEADKLFQELSGGSREEISYTAFLTAVLLDKVDELPTVTCLGAFRRFQTEGKITGESFRHCPGAAFGVEELLREAPDQDGLSMEDFLCYVRKGSFVDGDSLDSEASQLFGPLWVLEWLKASFRVEDSPVHSHKRQRSLMDIQCANLPRPGELKAFVKRRCSWTQVQA